MERIFSSTDENFIVSNVEHPFDGETTTAELVEERVGSLEYGCYFKESKIRGRCNLTIKQWFLQLSEWKDSISIKDGKWLQTVTYLQKCTKV